MVSYIALSREKDKAKWACGKSGGLLVKSVYNHIWCSEYGFP